ncbi:PD-(D/E)XK nuclease family protein [Sphaerospermopsis aphanizomenoides BCCUSP55]|uniref:PDDEXK-like family protein n=1 Tax=Sphaerospermopsis aphanizomenoides TaxID=459663 RepID=UPI0019055740|nr:PD-(D/E)XK nuclease family protein [Sphaerospermopsis aphanizomenoides]MBK1987428.1 PD-(D/E)XK nuclease family protein [Sphaerospermopsis aphanizomenoides BCCUSP55]
MISNKQHELLESFVDSQDLKKLKTKLAEFNIFEVIGVVRKEKVHSNLLAFLLDPSQNHRLGDIFLKLFLKRVLLETDNPTDAINHADIDIADLTDAEVSREKHYIDILIHSPQNKLVCVIENKIRSGERPNQLKKYEETINRHYKDCQAIFIYLNPEGSSPSETNWRTYDYYKVVEIIDSICISYKSILERDLYTLMTHYSTLIRRRIVSDSEIAKLCREIYFKHKQALDLIIEHRPKLQSKLQSEIDVEIKKLLNPLIKSNKIFADFWNNGYTSFGAKPWENENKLGSRTLIYFQFENLIGSLKMRVQIGDRDYKENRKEIPKKSVRKYLNYYKTKTIQNFST